MHKRTILTLSFLFFALFLKSQVKHEMKVLNAEGFYGLLKENNVKDLKIPIYETSIDTTYFNKNEQTILFGMNCYTRLQSSWYVREKLINQKQFFDGIENKISLLHEHGEINREQVLKLNILNQKYHEMLLNAEKDIRKYTNLILRIFKIEVMPDGTGLNYADLPKNDFLDRLSPDQMLYFESVFGDAEIILKSLNNFKQFNLKQALQIRIDLANEIKTGETGVYEALPLIIDSFTIENGWKQVFDSYQFYFYALKVKMENSKKQ